MRQQQTLLLLTPGFPKDELDTTCLPLQQQLVKAFRRIYPSFEIIILSLQYPYHNRPYKWFGTTVIPFGGRNKGGISKLRLRSKIYSLLKDFHHSRKIVGIISCWYGECAWVGHHFAVKNNLQHYCWILGQDARPNNKYPSRLKLSPGEIIALSDFLRDEFEKNHLTRPAHVIAAGVDPGLFLHGEKERTIDLVAVGSLISLKQFDIFLDVVAEAKRFHPFMRAILVGEGPEKNNLLNKIRKLDLESNIRLTGEIPYLGVLQLMEQSKVLVHPSSYEGFSGVCLEALHAGAQVVSFSWAMKERIDGWYIVENKSEMAEKVMEILKQPYDLPTTNAYSINDTARKFMNLFNSEKRSASPTLCAFYIT